MPGRTPREIRKSAGISLTAAAVHAGVAETTARVYELDPGAVSEQKRAQLDSFYSRLAEKAAHAP